MQAFSFLSFLVQVKPVIRLIVRQLSNLFVSTENTWIGVHNQSRAWNSTEPPRDEATESQRLTCKRPNVKHSCHVIAIHQTVPPNSKTSEANLVLVSFFPSLCTEEMIQVRTFLQTYKAVAANECKFLWKLLFLILKAREQTNQDEFHENIVPQSSAEPESLPASLTSRVLPGDRRSRLGGFGAGWRVRGKEELELGGESLVIRNWSWVGSRASGWSGWGWEGARTFQLIHPFGVHTQHVLWLWLWGSLFTGGTQPPNAFVHLHH